MVRLKFVPQDCWVGVYWKKEYISKLNNWWRFNIFICLLPMLPIHVWFGNSPWRRRKG